MIVVIFMKTSHSSFVNAFWSLLNLLEPQLCRDQHGNSSVQLLAFPVLLETLTNQAQPKCARTPKCSDFRLQLSLTHNLSPKLASVLRWPSHMKDVIHNKRADFSNYEVLCHHYCPISRVFLFIDHRQYLNSRYHTFFYIDGLIQTISEQIGKNKNLTIRSVCLSCPVC